MQVYETEDFIVVAAAKPHLTRKDGGHIVIKPKRKLVNRQELSAKQAIELMRLTIVVGQAMTNGLRKQGISLGRINYQDNGNWSVFKPEGPYFHIHLYGRAKDAKKQKYGQSLHFPHKDEHPEFYENLEPLNKEDVKIIKKEIELIFKQKKYSDSEWGLKN